LGLCSDLIFKIYIKTKYNPCHIWLYIHHFSINIGANTRVIVDTNLIRIWILGPAVSLHGSPTVSPTTAALCALDPLPPA